MDQLSLPRRLLKLVHPEGIPQFGTRIYNRLSTTAIFQHHYQQVARDIRGHCAEGALLDVGTGPGRLLLELYRQSPALRLVGLDVSPSMAEKARENVKEAAMDDRITIQAGSADHLPFADDSFDVVVSTGSLHHWKQPTAGLNEVHRVLKDGRYGLMYDLVSDTPQDVLAAARQNFGRWRTTLFWLHSFEEPFYSQASFEALARPTVFQSGQTHFVSLLCCLVLKKGQA